MRGIKSNLSFIRLVSNESGFLAEQRLRQAYSCLGLDETAEKCEVDKQYSILIKRYHPDTGGDQADPERLNHIRDAYKLILKTSVENELVIEEEDEKDFGIRHTVPQHRQYLEHGGVGYGTPSVRQRQFQQYRAANALENVREFTIEKTIRESQDPKNTDLIAVSKQRKKNRLTGMLDRVVEDMILEHMATGEFKNLKGAGKPLQADQSNPYIDQTQQTINRILRDNGFSPPWIMKEKELRERVETLKKQLRQELAHEIVILLNSDSYDVQNFLDTFDDDKILSLIKNKKFVDKEIAQINVLIRDYNLISPCMERQFMLLQKDLQLTRAKDDVLKSFPNSQFLIDAQHRFEQESNKKRRKKEDNESSFLKKLLNKFY